MLHYFFTVYILIQVCGSERPLLGWGYINLHCRDNENKPMDWWYLYKPPLGAGTNLDTGRNFSYIAPEITNRWEPSDRYINSNSMLQHTLSPLYRPTYANNLAIISYADRTADRTADNTTKGSTGRGLMMADELGGLWMGHTVPGLIDMKADRALFPEAELRNGHLVMCLSLDLPTLNLVAASIKETAPKVWHVRVPRNLRELLPNWQHFNRPATEKSPPPRPIEFETTDESLRVMMLIRRPGDKRCLYRSFARAKRIIMDVYGHDFRTKQSCEKGFGIRRIDSISVKYPESVYYIDNKKDRINFAVSTAAHWQKTGDGPQQYWACTGSVEREDATEKGGLVICVEDYSVWWSFDNLKQKEPKC